MCHGLNFVRSYDDVSDNPKKLILLNATTVTHYWKLVLNQSSLAILLLRLAATAHTSPRLLKGRSERSLRSEMMERHSSLTREFGPHTGRKHPTPFVTHGLGKVSISDLLHAWRSCAALRFDAAVLRQHQGGRTNQYLCHHTRACSQHTTSGSVKAD